MAYVVHLSITFLPCIGYGKMYRHFQATCLSCEFFGLRFSPDTRFYNATFRGRWGGSLLNLGPQSAAAARWVGVDCGPSGCSKVETDEPLLSPGEWGIR